VKAIVRDNYGPPDVLELEDLSKPEPGGDGVLLRVHATSVNPADGHILRGDPYVSRLQLGLREPKDRVLGCDVAGRVEMIGESVRMLRPGDEVFGSPFMRGFGAFAEHVRISEDLLAPKPTTLSFEQAAAVPLAASAALQGLRDHGRIEPGHKVLIVGASGGVGTFAVQIAKSFDAEVTGVCSTRNVDLVRSLGADHVIDYTQEDFTQSGERYDLIVDIPGNHPFSACRRVLTPDGKYVLIGHDRFGQGAGRWLGSLPRVLKLVVLSPFVSQLPPPNFSMPNKKDSMALLREFLEAGKLTPVIDRRYLLEEVPEAIRHLEEGHARGKLIIAVRDAEGSAGG
jgi:NADPH:quinone reductase-like Zn-dependent oxidoreductase